MRFGILGSLGVWPSGDRPLDLPGDKVRTLLVALLIEEGAVVSTDRLADLLWPSRSPRNPTGALHTRIWQLRRALEEAEPGAGDLVVSEAPGYSLATTAVDARRFVRLLGEARAAIDPRSRAATLADALALWRGPALTGFVDASFTQPVIARLEEQRLTALEDRAHALLALGEHSLLVGELADLLQQHPLRERLRSAQMLALYGVGRQGEALAAFDELRRRLDDELGLVPGSEMVALRQSILEHDPALTPPPSPITTTARPSTNLPAPVAGLIGRDAAVVQVRALLDASRLVTLHGSGGVGKTRLAIAVAEQLTDAYADGVWLVPLSDLDGSADAVRDERFSPEANLLATVLGVRDEIVAEGRAMPLALRLADALRPKELLLVVDNCEHVVAAIADLIELLLTAAPAVRVLATSREPLDIGGERLWTVPPLELPPAGKTDPDTAATSSAVRMFAARAMDTAPDFVLGPDNVDAVRTICRSLDGIPFALELAATRVRALGVHEVAERLENRFTLLTVGRRGAPARQQTLRAAIDWSWNLLTELEQVLLRRLAVFSGGAYLPAIEQVCVGDPIDGADVLDLLAGLVDRSLVTAVDVGSVRRYGLLESVGAYGVERLRDAGEEARVRLRHSEYHAQLAERALPQLRGPGQRRWLASLDTDSGNFRAALDVAVQHGAGDVALRMVNAMAWYWYLRGRLGEARRALAVALTPASTGAHRVKALAWQAGFELRAGDASYPLERYDALAEKIDNALAVETEDPLGCAVVRWFFGFACIGFGNQDSSEKRIDRALREFRMLGDDWGTAAALAALATQNVLRGDLDVAEQCGDESAVLFQNLGDGWGRLQAMDALASLAEARGDYGRAARLHRDGLRIAETLGLWTEVSIKLSGLARISLLHGEYAQSDELHERARRLAAEHSFTFGEQFAEVGLGLGARRQGRLDAAEVHLRRWLPWCRQLDGYHGVALILAELGFVAEERGDGDLALRLQQEGYTAAWATGDPRTVALSMEGVAGALSLSGHHERAALLLGAAASARDSVGAPLPAAERADIARVTARSRAAMGESSFSESFARGRVLGADDARALVLADR